MAVYVLRQQIYPRTIQEKHHQIRKKFFFSYSYPFEHFAVTERS